MTEIDTECLEAFPKWLAALNEDAVAMSSLLMAESIPERARRHVAGALNYLFRSLDLIPDGVEDLGYLDDAFVLRLASRLALHDAPEAREADIRGVLARLAQEAELVQQLLGSDYPRLEKYVRALEKGAGKGRTVDEVIAEPALRTEMVREVQQWARTYVTPTFSGDANSLVRLRSFLSTKLA